jgi:hypothetical protein
MLRCKAFEAGDPNRRRRGDSGYSPQDRFWILIKCAYFSVIGNRGLYPEFGRTTCFPIRF